MSNKFKFLPNMGKHTAQLPLLLLHLVLIAAVCTIGEREPPSKPTEVQYLYLDIYKLLVPRSCHKWKSVELQEHDDMEMRVLAGSRQTLPTVSCRGELQCHTVYVHKD